MIYLRVTSVIDCFSSCSLLNRPLRVDKVRWATESDRRDTSPVCAKICRNYWTLFPYYKRKLFSLLEDLICSPKVCQRKFIFSFHRRLYRPSMQNNVVLRTSIPGKPRK